jgi:hypothetical protein
MASVKEYGFAPVLAILAVAKTHMRMFAGADYANGVKSSWSLNALQWLIRVCR